MMKKVAYCGIEGAYASIAAKSFFPGESFHAFPSFGKAFDAVSEGVCDYGVFPIENSYAGVVAQVLDLLYFGDLGIVGGLEMPIVHNLLAVPGSDLSMIRRVKSHQQALDQCQGFLRERGVETLAASNTAVAARDVANAGDMGTAAIASRETADIYGLSVLVEDISDSRENTTRFVAVSRDKDSIDGRREVFSLVLTVKHEPMAFARAITAIGSFGFNMRDIKSRPSRRLPWSYYFYIEGEGDLSSENGREMIERLGAECELLRILGNY